jgi:predicted RNase H-like nuclease
MREGARRPRARGAARVVGADACVGGWVAVALAAGRVARVWVGASLAALLIDEPAATAVGVDLPLGGVPGGWRSTDREAKRLLGSQHAKVFAVPPRPVWDEPTYAAANARCRAITGAGLSVQAYRLVPKMLEAERYRDAGPHALYEIHPELVFALLAGGLLPYGKKTWNGQAARRALLAEVGVVLADDLPEVGEVPANDVLDAAAVAWGANRIASGVARCIPDPPDQYDHRRRPIVIWS